MIAGIWMFIAVYAFWRSWYFETRNEARMADYMLDSIISLHIGFGIAIIEGSVHNTVEYMIAILTILFTYASAYTWLSKRTSH